MWEQCLVCFPFYLPVVFLLHVCISVSLSLLSFFFIYLSVPLFSLSLFECSSLLAFLFIHSYSYPSSLNVSVDNSFDISSTSPHNLNMVFPQIQTTSQQPWPSGWAPCGWTTTLIHLCPTSLTR